ncbi:transposase [Pyramidobacter sp. SM-530-WT-4B]|uniref:Transposase n=1 Tax=Pyramidobacter porci TaxID=2605789 RepID=A0A6L5YAU9_9BACT|nr:transposase [Pyramidobacter porci]
MACRSGEPWREFPERYGKWQAVYAHFKLWKHCSRVG